MNRLLKLFSVIGISVIAFTSQISAKGYGMAGCGLGALAIQDNNFMQVFAATTNGTYYNQMFAITSGTSNCKADGIVQKDKEQEVFVALNYASLEQEMAMGKGEKLNSFATVMGCDDSSKQRFSKMIKEKYPALVNDNTTPGSLLSAIKTEIRKDETLSKSCKY